MPCNATIRLISLTIRSDHLDAGGNKLIKFAVPIGTVREVWQGSFAHAEIYMSSLGDLFAEFAKPEWIVAGIDRPRSHPASHTKNLPLRLDLGLELEVTGSSAKLGRLRGSTSDGSLTFEHDIGQTITNSQSLIVPDIVSNERLPNYVTKLALEIEWVIEIDGEARSLGLSGPHAVYVTYDTPGGGMDSPSANEFVEGGPTQVVTEERLQFAVMWAEGSGVNDEKECVDRIFRTIGIDYFLSRRWVPNVNQTGMRPKPTLHHYLWCCNVDVAKGECHNIAASFALACKIVGVKGKFEVGKMYPWPSRFDTPPGYLPKGDTVLGAYNVQYDRAHAEPSHGHEQPVFLDGAGDQNNFEGVAKYRNALYAIGDARFDTDPDPHLNASIYFSQRDRADVDWQATQRSPVRGLFDLEFSGEHGTCQKPYPWSASSRFRWED